MKIGDYVTVQEIMEQSACRWVVLSDLLIADDYDVEGGVVRFIEDTKIKAGKNAAQLELNGTPTLLVSGTWESLCVGGVFVE